MSAETKDALDAAIAAHLADEFEGSFLSHWVVSAAGAHPERSDRTQYIFECGDDTAHHTAHGLLYLMGRHLDRGFGAE